jgi:2-alkyl-3-oxoalkanoate reductase
MTARLGAAIGAKPPHHVPAWLGRLAIGSQGTALMTESRGASNAKAKRELGWRTQFPSWRGGFRCGLGGDCEMAGS